MKSDGMLRPYVVAAFFSDGTAAYHMLMVQEAVSADTAAALVVSKYYVQLGGKLALVTSCVMEIGRETLTRAAQMLDAIDSADRAEAEKVITLARRMPPDQPPAV